MCRAIETSSKPWLRESTPFLSTQDLIHSRASLRTLLLLLLTRLCRRFPTRTLGNNHSSIADLRLSQDNPAKKDARYLYGSGAPLFFSNSTPRFGSLIKTSLSTKTDFIQETK